MKEFYEKWEVMKEDLKKRLEKLQEMTDYMIHFDFQLHLETRDGFKKDLPERSWAFYLSEKYE